MGWFLAAEGARASAAEELAEFEQKTPEEIRARRIRDPRQDRIVSLGAIDPRDVSLPVLPPTKRKPNDLAAFARKKLRQLVEKKEVQTLAQIVAYGAQGLSEREIAEKMGMTRRQVQTQPMHFSKILISETSTT